MAKEKGIVLTVTLIFVVVLIIMTGSALVLMTNHARITETQISRIRAFYTAEAAIIEALEDLREGSGVNDVSLNGLTAVVAIESSPCTGPNGTCKLSATVSY